jgi:polysaccharide export outer membrane protein
LAKKAEQQVLNQAYITVHSARTIRINTMTKTPAVLLATVILLLLSLQSTWAAEGGSYGDTYRIQPGDVLEVSVWKEEDLVKQVLVRPDGGMSFPLAGNIQAAGKSIPELQELITEQLTKYIPDPVVTVATLKLDGNKVYVIGKVARPGEFLANRYMDVVQALSVAGGMTPYAADNKIIVLRRENGKQARSVSLRGYRERPGPGAEHHPRAGMWWCRDREKK